MPPSHQFKVGDRVQWVTTRETKHSIRFTHRQGKIKEIIGTLIYVLEDGKGRAVSLSPADLKPAQDFGGPLTELLYALAGEPLPDHLKPKAP